MEDLLKDKDAPLELESSSNARQMALELSFDKDAFDKLDAPISKKKRKSSTSSASIETEAGPTKKTKVTEVPGVNPVLMSLQMKKNEARMKAKEATAEEEAILAAGPQALKMKEAREAKAKQKEFYDKLAESGVDPERFTRLHETQESIEQEAKKKNRSVAPDATVLGPSVANFAASFHRRQKDVVFDPSKYEEQKEKLGSEFYSDISSASVLGHVPDEDKLDAMVAELDKQGSKRKDFHRRRTFKEDKDITFINEANRQYNKQLEKAYGKHTGELKEAIERGTAL